jgi:hypothetical protein
MLAGAAGASIRARSPSRPQSSCTGGSGASWRRERSNMLAATETYPLLEVFWTMLIFFAFIVWIWMLFVAIGDIFRRSDIGGWAKTAWIVVLVIIPYFGVFIYLIAEHKGMTERTLASQQQAEEQFADYVKNVSNQSSPADQIAAAKKLMDEGTIDAAEFESIKQKALAA